MGRCWFREKGLNFFGLRREQRSSLISLGTTESHSDVTRNQRLRRWQGISHKLTKKEVRLSQRDHQWESQSNGITERTVGVVAGQARTLKAALEHRIGVKVPLDAVIL